MKGEFGPKEESVMGPGGKYSTEKQRREKAKASDFLMPSERKFPYKIGGKISCPLLKAAISRAGQTHRTAIEAKARAMYKANC